MLAVLLAFLFFEIVYWLFNLGVLGVVLGSGLALADKLIFLLSPFRDIFSSTSGIVGAMVILVAVIQGVNLAVLVYTVKHLKRLNTGVISGGSIAGLLAAIGLGCSVCGTSLLVPIVAVFASTSAVAISEKLTIIASPLAVIIGLIGLYYLGIQVANINAKLKQSSQPEVGSR